MAVEKLVKLPEGCLIDDDVSDKTMSNDFENSGSIYPKVSPDIIADLIRKVRYETNRVSGTTTINATAILVTGGMTKTKDGFIPHTFTLATCSTACADPRNFNEEKGKFYAIQKASKSARDKLWELEGYALFKELQKEN